MMLVQYDRAMKALSTALNSRDVSVVLQSRSDLELMKLRAKQLQDRELLSKATEFHMRVERWLGMLLIEARKAGQIRDGRRSKDGDANRITLKEIGVDQKLSSKAQYAAALGDEAFEAAVTEMRASMAAGKAKLVNAVSSAEKAARRRPSHENSSYGFLLECGTRLGSLKVGTLRSRIERLGLELRILEAVADRVGSISENAMASIEESISEGSLDQMISAAQRKSSAA
jgi:hypothetical protein